MKPVLFGFPLSVVKATMVIIYVYSDAHIYKMGLKKKTALVVARYLGTGSGAKKHKLGVPCFLNATQAAEMRDFKPVLMLKFVVLLWGLQQ